MNVEHEGGLESPSDAPRISEFVRVTSKAEQRDRHRVVLIAGEELVEKTELQREEIAALVVDHDSL